MKEHTLSPADGNDKHGKEIIGIDVMKAFFAICVVAIHTHPYSIYTSKPYTIARIFDVLLLCAVPFFFITTGYFMGKKLQIPFSNRNNIRILNYYLSKYLKLYLIWTAVYLPITLYYYIVISEQSVVLMLLDFLRGLLLFGEHWNSWMLWYLLSMIYALILFEIIWRLKADYYIVYITSTFIFILSAIYAYYLNIGNAGFIIQGMRLLLGDNARLLIAPFYLSIGMIIGRTQMMTFKLSLGTGIALIFSGLILKICQNNVGGYSQFTIAMCASGIFLLASMWKTDKKAEGLSNLFMRKLRTFSLRCYFTHMMVYTLLCIFVWNELKSGADVFITVIGGVIGIYIILDIVYTVKRRKNGSEENSEKLS